MPLGFFYRHDFFFNKRDINHQFIEKKTTTKRKWRETAGRHTMRNTSIRVHPIELEGTCTKRKKKLQTHSVPSIRLQNHEEVISRGLLLEMSSLHQGPGAHETVFSCHCDGLLQLYFFSLWSFCIILVIFNENSAEQ